MNRWSSASAREREGCHTHLKALFDAVLEIHDCTWVCGKRGMVEQNELHRRGLSKLTWPNSKHNTPDGGYSRAADVAPWNPKTRSINWNNREEFVYFAGIVKGVAEQLGVTIRWGGDWNSDNDLRDQTFFDLGHFELHE